MLTKQNDKFKKDQNSEVRKYDDFAHRFTSTDVMWEKYISWNPYQYCMGDPVNKVDVNGKDVIVLMDYEGAAFIPTTPMGHTAVLIGNDNDGWDLYSKNGAKNGGAFGDSKYQDGGDINHFESLSKFLSDGDKNQVRYDEGYRISTTSKEDDKSRDAAGKQVKEYYNLKSNSCADTPSAALNAIGKSSGTSLVTTKDKDGNIYKNKTGNPIPKNRYKDIKKGNKGVKLDLNRMRTEKVPNS